VRTTRAATTLLALGALAAAQSPSPEPGPTPTPPVEERLLKVQQRRRGLEQELLALRRQEKSLLGEVERLELEVRLRGEQLREVQLDLARTNEQLDATLKRLRQIERQIEESRPVLAARARALYKLGELSYLRLLLSVDRPADIFRGYRLVTQLARRDNERFIAFRSDLLAQAKTRAELEQRTQQAQELRADVERARRGLYAERRRKTELLTEMVEKKETHRQYVEELQQAESRLGQMLEGLEAGDVSLPVAAFRGSLPWPLAGKVKVPFGRRKDAKFDTYTLHNGIEIDTPAETPVHAVHEATVVFADRFRGYGLMVVLDHGHKHHTLYAHLAEIAVQNGQRLPAGHVIGATGAGLEGNGLYFEVRFQGKPEDPLDWLKRERDRERR
jgi:septal ring factor EnvC (AmiA/AmiB activator)